MNNVQKLTYAYNTALTQRLIRLITGTETPTKTRELMRKATEQLNNRSISFVEYSERIKDLQIVTI